MDVQPQEQWDPLQPPLATSRATDHRWPFFMDTLAVAMAVTQHYMGHTYCHTLEYEGEFSWEH